MNDKIEKWGDTLLQHGPLSNRIYVMHYDESGQENLMERLEDTAKENGYQKIIVKADEKSLYDFNARGYKAEAFIENYFETGSKCLFLSKFLSKERAASKLNEQCYDNGKLCDKYLNKVLPPLEDIFEIRPLAEADAQKAADLYKEVFASYPFPIFDVQYILETMKGNILYFGVFNGKELIATASLEANENNYNCEMSDFAVKKSFRGKRLALHLLTYMEREARKIGIQTAYSIARAGLASMNATFAANKYLFGGQLINNTHIDGNIESMNVWYKQL